MTDERINEITEEASDELGADSQEDCDENWSPESAKDRAQYDKAVQAVDLFIENHPTYKQTDENRQEILDYLESHDLLISKASLELAWEQIGDRLDLAEQRDSKEQPDASARLATYALARGTKSEEEPPESVENEPEPQEGGRRGVAWRNGREIQVGT